MSPPATRSLSVALAAGAAAGYLMSGTGVVLSAAWAAPMTVAAALLALLLKVVFFDRWLSLGIGLDVVILTSVLAGWPVAVT